MGLTIYFKGGNMQNLSEITISINLLSGDPIVFKIEANDDRQRNAGARIDRGMKANYMGSSWMENLLSSQRIIYKKLKSRLHLLP